MRRYWFPIKRVILIWPFQYANEVGSWWFSWNSYCFLCKRFSSHRDWSFSSHFFRILEDLSLYHHSQLLSSNSIFLTSSYYSRVSLAAIFTKLRAWWDRLWVLRKQDWPALHFADKCFHRRQGRQRTEDLPLVWPNHKIPLLLRPMEFVPGSVSILSYYIFLH